MGGGLSRLRRCRHLESVLKIGVFQHGWWEGACRALTHDVVLLPVALPPGGNAYAADLAARVQNGTVVASTLRDQPVDLLLDNGATGLGFVRGSAGGDDLQIAHETSGVVLCSHFIDPLTTVFQGLDWRIAWQCLQSQSWVKAVWDRAQVAELTRFGAPNVMHLPMAAPDRIYDTRPLDPSKCQDVVSFVGGQNTNYFSQNVTVPTTSLFAGVMAHAIRADLPGLTFCEIYHDTYGIGEPPKDEDDLATRADKVMTYFNAKLFYHASLCLRNRDRFVIFLKRQLGDKFYLVGTGWDTAYGLSTAPRFETSDAYFNHFREAAINLNLVNGNAETGLNMRHYEITAAGGFLLCYEQPELGEHFEIGKECAVFRNESDLLDKIEYYLANPEERVAIAQAGQQRTLNHHLYRHRLQTVLQAIQPGPPPVEYATTKLWDDVKSLLPEADIVLDCGANIGQMARSFRNTYPGAEIYSFEPVRSVFEQLRKTCEEVNAHAVRKAVADRDGTATINLTASAEANSLLDFQEGNPCAKWTRVVGRETVEVCSLDRWCRDNDIDTRRVDLVKLDVQGAELQALKGAPALLETARLIYLEVSFVPIYKDCPLFGEIDGFLKAAGYRRHAVYPSDQPKHWGDALYVKIPQPANCRAGRARLSLGVKRPAHTKNKGGHGPPYEKVER